MTRSLSLRLLLLLAVGLLTLPCSGREILTFRSGFTLEASSHTLQGATIVITMPGGTLSLPAEELISVQASAAEEVATPMAPSASSPLSASPSQQVSIPSVPDTEALLTSAAQNAGLTAELVRSVAKVESGLASSAVSPKGALGLMQLMPATAADLGVNPSDPGQNAAGGASYLRQLLLRYHGNAALALAAYNAGPGSVAKYGGVPPFSETRRYVVRVLQELAREQAVAASRKPGAPADAGRSSSR